MSWRRDWKFRMTQAGLAVSFLVAAFYAYGLAQGQQDIQTGRGTIVSVEPVRQMREDFDLWPLIVHPKSAAERRINATLTHLNGEIAKKVRDCLSGQFAWSKDFTGGEWQRTIKVTMTGPQFLSMVASDGFYCGGAHPDDDLVVLVFNLATGEQVDWSTQVSKSAAASLPKNVPGDEDGTPPLMLPELQKIYARAQETYCKEYFEDERPFVLWPDAESGTLAAEVAGLPHVAQPCKSEMKLTIEQARKLGFNESLLWLIEEAHRIAVDRPKAKPVRKQSAPTAATHPDSL